MTQAGGPKSYPGWRRSACLGCGRTIVTARDPHVIIGGRRDGTQLIVMDVEPLLSRATNPDALIGADALYHLGAAHRACLHRARRRLEAGEVDLPDELPTLTFSEEDEPLPALNEPPSLDRCPFCTRLDATEEHVFPQWLSRQLTAIGAMVDVSNPDRPRPVRKIDLTAPICSDCNTRWLSVLENDAKPILAPMIRGEESTLSPVDQKIAATWALKTAMMLDLAGGAPVIPTGFFHTLRQRREPQHSHAVWIAGYSGKLATTANHQPLRISSAAAELPVDAPANGFVSTFSIFRLVFQVVGHFEAGTSSMNEQRDYRDALGVIWPQQTADRDWPPKRLVFNDESLRELAASIRG